VRYSLIAILADHYGLQVMRVLQHPAQYWNWLLLFAAIIAGVIAIVIVIKKQLETTPSTD
jgi:surface polysaccharide O-acyltransferase-like enzyme